MTATPAQIDYLTSLQAEADGMYDYTRTFEAFKAHFVPPTQYKGIGFPDDLSEAATFHARQTGLPRPQRPTERTPETRAAYRAAHAEFLTAAIQSLYELHQSWAALATTDPATMTKAEASRAIDVLKSAGRRSY